MCFVGDLIDRGPQSAEVVQFIIDNNYHCIRGNHEQMMIDAYKETSNGLIKDSDGYGDWYDIWLCNGGKETLLSYEKKDTFIKHREWMKKLPLFKRFHIDGKRLFVSHAGLSGYNKKFKDNSRGTEKDIMWHREYQYVPNGYFSVFGHTPKPNYILNVKDRWCNTDTGAFRKRTFSTTYGVLTAIQFPSLQIFQQENIE